MSGLILPRRGLISGVAALLAAPAVVRAEALMPVLTPLSTYTLDFRNAVAALPPVWMTSVFAAFNGEISEVSFGNVPDVPFVAITRRGHTRFFPGGIVTVTERTRLGNGGDFTYVHPPGIPAV